MDSCTDQSNVDVLINQRKYRCMADFLFDWFGFDQTSKTVDNSTKAKQLNTKEIKRRSAIQ